MIFVGSGVFAQQKALQFPLKARVFSLHTRSNWGNKFNGHYRQDRFDKATRGNPICIRPISYLPGNYYAANLGFVCRQEIRLEKSTGIPFRFRLGSVQQVDWLEGKNSGFGYPK